MLNQAAPLGERVRDVPSGFEGVCTALSLRWHGPLQVAIERRDANGKIEEAWFMAERVAAVDPALPGAYA